MSIANIGQLDSISAEVGTSVSVGGVTAIPADALFVDSPGVDFFMYVLTAHTRRIHSRIVTHMTLKRY
jgi:hypothetical protein